MHDVHLGCGIAKIMRLHHQPLSAFILPVRNDFASFCLDHAPNQGVLVNRTIGQVEPAPCTDQI